MTQYFLTGSSIADVHPFEGLWNWEEKNDFITTSAALGSDVTEVFMMGWGGRDTAALVFETEADGSRFVEMLVNHMPDGLDLLVLDDSTGEFARMAASTAVFGDCNAASCAGDDAAVTTTAAPQGRGN